jgi:hypothetical protein
MREMTLKYDSVNHQIAALTVNFIIQKLAFVNTAIYHPHFTLVTLIILPNTTELTTINPGDHTKTLSFTCTPVTLISGLLELGSVLAWQTIVVLHRSESARSTIFKCSAELVTVFEIDHTETKQSLSYILNLLV